MIKLRPLRLRHHPTGLALQGLALLGFATLLQATCFPAAAEDASPQPVQLAAAADALGGLTLAQRLTPSSISTPMCARHVQHWSLPATTPIPPAEPDGPR